MAHQLSALVHFSAKQSHSSSVFDEAFVLRTPSSTWVTGTWKSVRRAEMSIVDTLLCLGQAIAICLCSLFRNHNTELTLAMQTPLIPILLLINAAIVAVDAKPEPDEKVRLELLNHVTCSGI